MYVVLCLSRWLIHLYLLCANVHPYHVSATEMEYDMYHQRIEISTKIFTDDFENVLAKVYKQKIDLVDKALKPQMTTFIMKYLVSHLAVRNKEKLLTLKLYGWEVDHEAIYIYTTADAPSFDPNNIVVEKTVLYDLFDDQVNIIHFIYNGKRISTKLTYPEKRATISFSKK